MRLLHLTNGKIFGGIERLLVTFAQYQHVTPELQHEFAVCYDAQLVEDLRRESAPVTLLGDVRLRDPLSIWRARRAYGKLLDAGIDATMIHGCWAQGVFGTVARRRRIPIMFYTHDLPEFDFWFNRWVRMVPPDLLLANSEFAGKWFEGFFRCSNTAIVPCSVPPPPIEDHSTRLAKRKECGVEDDRVVLLMATRLEVFKGHRVLLESLAKLPRSLENQWVCWVAGAPQKPGEEVYFQELQDRAKAAGLEQNIRFLGHRRDVRQLLTAADVYCQPNQGPESFGISIIEALYHGLPVLTSRTGGPGEIVTDEVGFRAEPGDSSQVAHYLTQLITDAQLRERLGKAGPTRARELSDPATTMERLARLTRELVGKPARVGSA